MKKDPALIERCSSEVLGAWHARASNDRLLWANHELRKKAVVERAFIIAAAREEIRRFDEASG